MMVVHVDGANWITVLLVGMPIVGVIATAVALTAASLAASAGATAAAGIYGANKQSKANKDAAGASLQSNREALAWEREQDALNRAQYGETEAQNRRRWDIEADRDERRYVLNRGDSLRGERRDVDMYNAESRRRQPYRDVSVASLNDLAARAGLNVRATAGTTVANNTPSAPPPATMADLLAKAQAADAAQRRA